MTIGKVNKTRILPSIIFWAIFGIVIINAVIAAFNQGDIDFTSADVLVLLVLACIFLVPALMTTRRYIALKNFKASSICYDAKVLELIKAGFWEVNRKQRVVAKCAYVDEHGVSHTLTSRNKFNIEPSGYALRSGGFKKVHAVDELTAKVYISRDNPEKFFVELFWAPSRK